MRSNKKILLDNLPCVLNLTKTDPRLHNCTANAITQLRLDQTKLQQEPSNASISTLSNVLAKVCPILNTTFACTEPIIVPHCGREIFNLSMTLAANALKSFDIDCGKNGQNPFSNATGQSMTHRQLGLHGDVTTEKPKAAAANFAVSSMLMLLIGAIFVF